MKPIVSLIAMVSVLTIFACKNQNISKDEMLKIVANQNEKLEACFKEGNAEKLAQMYADSAKLCPNGYGFVIGRDRIKAFWAEDFKTSKVLEMKTDVQTIDGNIDVIYETGKTTSKILIEDSLYVPTVKYINVWRKQPNGSYKLDIDFWNKDGK
jgi:ketosteroid isomerase-like protein